MAIKVKLFQSAQEYFHQMGIYPIQPNRKFAFNLTSFCILIAMIMLFIPSTAFFLLKAQTMDEYSDTFYTSSSMLAFIFCFLVNIWKMPKFAKLIEKCENYISKSNYFNSSRILWFNFIRKRNFDFFKILYFPSNQNVMFDFVKFSFWKFYNIYGWKKERILEKNKFFYSRILFFFHKKNYQNMVHTKTTFSQKFIARIHGKHIMDWTR